VLTKNFCLSAYREHYAIFRSLLERRESIQHLKMNEIEKAGYYLDVFNDKALKKAKAHLKNQSTEWSIERQLRAIRILKEVTYAGKTGKIG
jgi:hypothetical protein